MVCDIDKIDNFKGTVFTKIFNQGFDLTYNQLNKELDKYFLTLSRYKCHALQLKWHSTYFFIIYSMLLKQMMHIRVAKNLKIKKNTCIIISIVRCYDEVDFQIF